jgi:hypothetical protein
MNAPEKLIYWMGDPIDETFSREKLLEIIIHLAEERDSLRDRAMRDLEMMRLFAKARR